ncbi:acyltransferase [Streptomyces sp. NBC_00555]|uniref:acyltransferase family protein n=1 Tax=Streptomyces sp. NBC_00555 TaxID=2903662 RepID=UPI00225A2F8C|nr:acyltransferase [Streptomyces sp. NBC_00555]MCX5015216.1 acyltransferase [Streptomyces sp. NBC_00555]
MTGLRFVLALVVVLSHVFHVSGLFDGPLQMALGGLAPLAGTAVTGFFVLSGFVLTWAHRPGDRPRAFWRRRFWKIFPNHVLGWSLAVVFFGCTGAGRVLSMETGHGSGAAVTGLFLLQAWVPDVNWFFSFNTPAWSISCEAFFYALFPALLALTMRIPARRLRAVWVAVVLVILVLPAVTGRIPGPALYDWLPVNENSLWFGYVLPPVRLPEFVLGIVTARLLQTGLLPRPTRAWSRGLPVAVLATLPFVPPQFALGAAMAAPMTVVIAGLALADIEGRSGFLARPAAVALGDASYALYLVHFPLLLLARWLAGPERTFDTWTGVPLALGLTGLSVGAAWVVYRCYERPITRAWSRKALQTVCSAPLPTPARPREEQADRAHHE